MTVVDLACVPPLSCRATVFAPRALDAEIFGGRVVGDDEHFAITFVEPLELVTAARSLDGELRAFAASRDALALLREASEPTASAWRWVCDQLAIPDNRIDPPEPGSGSHPPEPGSGSHPPEPQIDRDAGFVVARGTDLHVLPDDGEFLPHPLLALTRQELRYALGWAEPTHELIDADSFGARDLALERCADGWLVRERHRDLLVNGTTVDAPYRLATGDHLRTERWSYQVIAII